MVSAAPAPQSTDNSQYARNLAAFERFVPELHATLLALKEVHSKLVVLPDGGGVDMSLKGQHFYGMDAVAFTEAQLVDYFARPLRLFFNEPNPELLKGTCGDYCLRVEAAMAAAGLTPKPSSIGDESHFAVVLGVGLGLHVEPLIRHTDCRVLLLVEPIVENIHHSMSVLDWAGLLAKADEQGREILFITRGDTAGVLGLLRNAIRARSPALLDGIYVYSHYPSSLLANVRDRFQRELFLNIAGMGFVEDEVRMMANTCANLARGETLVINRQHPFHNTPLFVVGSGPSVDADLDFIAANRERAVVMTIGSGLWGALERGIRPDYHVELENGNGTGQLIELVAAEFDLSGITLICGYSVCKSAVAQFDQVFYFFRERVCATELFGDVFRRISPAGPTVANSGVAAAIRFGFQEIYLFGVDMGSKSQDRYHSSGSFYGRGVLPEAEAALVEFPGNFGGTGFAENVLIWSRQSLESLLLGHPFVRCYNCSDGVRIAGATPKLKHLIELPKRPVDRDAMRLQIRQGLSVYTPERLQERWNDGSVRTVLRDMHDRMSAVLEAASAQSKLDLRWMHEIADVVGQDDTLEKRTMSSFVYGTTLLILGCTWWYDRRLHAGAERQAFRRIALTEMRKAVDDMNRQVMWVCDESGACIRGEQDDVIVP